MVQERHIYDCQAGCPVESTLQIISGKWKSVIIYQLLQHSNLHFGDLTRFTRLFAPHVSPTAGRINCGSCDY